MVDTFPSCKWMHYLICFFRWVILWASNTLCSIANGVLSKYLRRTHSPHPALEHKGVPGWLWGYGDDGFLHRHFSCPISFFTCIAPRITAPERQHTSSFLILYLLSLYFFLFYIFVFILFITIFIYFGLLHRAQWDFFTFFSSSWPAVLFLQSLTTFSLPLTSLSLEAQAAEIVTHSRATQALLLAELVLAVSWGWEIEDDPPGTVITLWRVLKVSVVEYLMLEEE